MIDLEKLREYRRKNDMLEARSQTFTLEEVSTQLKLWREAMRRALKVSA